MTEQPNAAVEGERSPAGIPRTRRSVLRTTGLVAASGALAGATGSARATDDADLGSWLSNVGNYDGVVDATGDDEVSISVGAEGNGGAFGFDPPAVRVDPGTTVVWEWTGEGGSHNVVAADGGFESELTGRTGHTFERAFDEPGVVRYSCRPHAAMGMKGVVVVGDVAVETPAPAGRSTGRAPDEAAEEDAERPPDGGPEPDYGGWFDDVDNFDGTVDRRGTDEVTVAVGAEGNGGAFAFDPPAVRVDPGTTVVWEWTGEGGAHNVVDPETGYESPLRDEAGATYELVFDGAGVSTYACEPHAAMGMKGAVVVGDAAGAGSAGLSPETAAVGGSFLAALLSPVAFGLFLWRRGGGRSDATEPTSPALPAAGGERSRPDDHGLRTRRGD